MNPSPSPAANGSEPLAPPQTPDFDALETTARAFLLVVRGEQEGRLFELEGAEVLIGRSAAAQVRLTDAAVSAKHARIVASGGVFHVVDLGSTNGTYVNGERVVNTLELRSGDAIQLSDVVLAYLSTADQDRTALLRRVTPQLAAMKSSREAPAAVLAPGMDGERSLEEHLDRVVAIGRFAGRHWKLLTATTLLAALIGAASVRAAPPEERAEVVMRLDPTPNNNPVEHVERQTFQFFASAEQAFNHPDVVRATLTALGEADVSDARVEQERSRLSISSSGLEMYRGSYVNPDASAAVRFLDQHVRTFVDHEIGKTLQALESQVRFLTSRLAETERELTQREDELREFKEKHVHALPELAQEQLAGRATLVARRTELSAELTRVNAELHHAQKRLKTATPVVEDNVERSRAYEGALADVGSRLAAAKAQGFSEKHPEIMLLSQQAAELRALRDSTARAEVTDSEKQFSRSYRELADRVSDLQATSRAADQALSEMDAQLGRMDGIVRSLPEVEAEFTRLTRAQTASRELEGRLRSQLDKTRLQLELERASAAARYDLVTPVHSAAPPQSRAVVLRSGMGGTLGLALGLVIAAGIELRRLLGQRGRRRLSATASAPR
jgi:hypothetical protein